MAEHQQDLGKIIDLPQAEKLLERFPDGTIGLTPQTDAFYRRFAEIIGGSERVAVGLNMAWDIASDETLRAFPVDITLAVDMNFDRVMDAIVPDAEVAEQAKSFRRKMLME